MNSDGEKMPPDAPEPRLIEVAKSLATNSSGQDGKRRELACQQGLDRRVADALDVIMPEKAQQRIDQDADQQHADDMAQIGIVDPLEDVLGAARSPRTKPPRRRP